MTIDERVEKGIESFKSGLNCAQAVLAAFPDITGNNADTMQMAASPLGGGIGRLREVCGTVSGAVMILGLAKGSTLSKNEIYSLTQEFAERFKKLNGSIICRELLNPETAKDTSSTPSERTEQYYKKRPCALLVGDSVKLIAEILEENNGK